MSHLLLLGQSLFVRDLWRRRDSGQWIPLIHAARALPLASSCPGCPPGSLA